MSEKHTHQLAALEKTKLDPGCLHHEMQAPAK
jgi:hypothetical protein